MGTIFLFDERYEAPLQVFLTAAEGTAGADIQRAILEATHDQHSDRQLAISNVPLSALCWGDSQLHDGAELHFLTSDISDISAAPYCITAIGGPDTGQSYHLKRGRHSLGKGNSADLCFSDDSFQEVQGYLELGDSGLIWSDSIETQIIEANKPFFVGNSIFEISAGVRRPAGTKRNISVDPVEIELPPKRQNWMYLLMVLAPIVIGLIIVALTKMWLFFIMSIASSLMMGIHWYMSKGETKKALQIITSGAQTDQDNAQRIPTLEDLCLGDTFFCEQNDLLVIGQGERQAHLKNRNIADYRMPTLTNVPLVVRLKPESCYLLDVPLAVIRAALLGLVAQSTQVVFVASQDSELQETFSILSLLPHVSVVESVDLLAAQTTRRIVVIAASEYKKDTPLVASGDTLIVVGSVSSSQRENFVEVISSTGFFKEKILRSTTSQEEHWANGLSLQTLYRAVGRRLGRVNTELSAEPTTHSLEAFKLAGYSSQSFFAEDLFAHIGVSDTGVIDGALNADGPHWLIAGTTGSGKSELLRTMLLSLALKYPPQRVCMFLVDFKGGATLGIFEKLPHVSNVLSDLDAESVDRALRYLMADLVAREKEFHNYGVSNYRDYLALHHNLGKIPGFPEVLIVVDEFKMLVDQLPQAMTDLMKVATIGRSLGVHLILATQRPQGAVSQDIRANIALNICLRVSSAQDSHNVLGADIASTISSETPGRGYISRSGEKPLLFQAPLFTGRYTEKHGPSASVVSFGQPRRTMEVSENLVEVVADIAALPVPAVSYVPVPQALPPRSSVQAAGPGCFSLGASESPALALCEHASWNPQKDGALVVIDDSAARVGFVSSLMMQAVNCGKKVVVFTADLLFYERLLPFSENNKIAGLLSAQDLVYCEYAIDRLLSAESSESGCFVLFDSLDIWLELSTRNPDLENKIHQLLRDGHRFGLAVLATSAQNLRAKTQTNVANVLWSADAIEKDPFKKTAKNFPHPNSPHQVLEGEIAKRISSGAVSTLVLSPVEGNLEQGLLAFPQSQKLFSQLPVSTDFSAMQAKSDSLKGKCLYLGVADNSEVKIQIITGRFIPIVGKKGSGKTALLGAIRHLNPEFSFLTIAGKSHMSLEALEKALAQVHNPQFTVLLIDDLNYLEKPVQDRITTAAKNFASTVVTYSPWNRWLTSPVLAGLQGTTRGIALMPDQRSLEIFAAPELPANLRTNGQIMPGRAVLFTEFSTAAFQVPYSAK